MQQEHTAFDKIQGIVIFVILTISNDTHNGHFQQPAKWIPE